MTTNPAPDAHEAVEAVVRRQLATALGGKRGIAEGAIPTIGFTVCWVASHDLRLSLIISIGLAVAALLLRVVQRSNPQFVINALVGIAIAAVFAMRSGEAEDAFLPGIIYNAVYAVVLTASIVLRWPLMGFLIGGVTGDPTGWRRDPEMVRLCARLTWLFVLPCALRVVVQFPLWRLADQDVLGAAWLGVAKLVMGWPLQLAAIALMVLVLNRDRTRLSAGRRPAAEESHATG